MFLYIHEGSLESKSSLVKVDKDNVIIEVIKKAEDSDELVIRMYECHNMRTNVTLEMISEIESVKECNLMETDISELSKDGNKVSFEMKPFEILTLKVKLK